MHDLVDIHYPDAEIIRVVQDNLSTHSAGALYQAFPPAEARRILRRLENESKISLQGFVDRRNPAHRSSSMESMV
jgi:hypothetical protein